VAESSRQKSRHPGRERGIGSGVFQEEVEASCWGSADFMLH
jgi:hypothetical protein